MEEPQIGQTKGSVHRCKRPTQGATKVRTSLAKQRAQAVAVLAIDRDTEGERRESGRLRMQRLFDASSQAEYAAAGASGTHWENGRRCLRAISQGSLQMEPWVLPSTRVAVYRPFFSSVSFDMEVNYASGIHTL